MKPDMLTRGRNTVLYREAAGAFGNKKPVLLLIRNGGLVIRLSENFGLEIRLWAKT